MADWKRYVQEKLQLPEMKRMRRERIIEEISVQLEDIEREALARGASVEEARRQAAAHISDWEDLSSRLAASERPNLESRTATWMEETGIRLEATGGAPAFFGHLMRDVRGALRSLRSEPSFWAVTLLLLGLGIGAATTIFSVVDGVLLRGLPYTGSDRLMTLRDPSFQAPRYRDFVERLDIFEEFGGRWDREMDWTGGERPIRLTAGLVTPGYFEVFEARAASGRLFVEEEYRGAPHRAVLSHGFWQRHFGSDPSAVGRVMRLNEETIEIVGVLDRGFHSPDGLEGNEMDLWLAMDPSWEVVDSSGLFILELYGRLKPGLTRTAAQQEVDRVIGALAEEKPALHRNRDGEIRTVGVAPLQTIMIGDVRSLLLILLGAVGLLLLIACANVANLFLARGTRRSHEVAVRASLGAGRSRILAQLLTESIVFGLIGGAIGILLAFAGVRAFEVLNPGDIPLIGRIGVDPRVLGFAVAISLLTGIVFGIVPALRAARLDVTTMLKDSSRSGAGPDRGRLRSMLVVAEIALALILLAGSGLLFSSFLRLQREPMGFDPTHLAGVELELRLGDDLLGDRSAEETRARILERIRAGVEALPGVRNAAIALTAPFQYFGRGRTGWSESEFTPEEGEMREVRAMIQPVSPEYFEALGASIRGRAFTSAEEHDVPIPVVVSGSFARGVFGDVEAVGRTFRGLAQNEVEKEFRVVGVLQSQRHWGLEQGDQETLYIPWKIGAWIPFWGLTIRTEGDPGPLLAAIREAIWEVVPDVALPNAFTVSSRIADSLTSPRFYSALLGFFAVVALLITGGGIYGSMLYAVGRRRREFGIRSVLGANRERLIRLVLRSSLRITSLGLLLGIIGALLCAGFLRSMLFGVSPADPATMASVAAIMAVVAIAASLVPAVRASAADPVEALRAE